MEKSDATQAQQLQELLHLKKRMAELERQLQCEGAADTEDDRLPFEIEYLLSAVDTLKTGVTISDATQADLPLIYINHAFEEMTGYSAAETLGTNCRFLQGEETDVKAVEQIRQALDAHEPCTVELLNYRKDGTPFWNELTLTPVFAKDGKLQRYLGLQTDVTRRKLAEQALSESEIKFRTLADMTAAGILIHQGGVFLYLNPAAEKLTGYRLNELLHRRFWEVVHPDYQEMVRQRGLSRLQGDAPAPEYEIKIIRKDGAERWVHLTNGLIEYDGRPAVMSTVFDITERKEAEALSRQIQELTRHHAEELEERVTERTTELATSEMRLRTFLESSPDPIVIYDEVGNVTYTNPVFTQTFGWQLNEIYGRRLDFVPTERWPETEVAIKKLFAEGRIFDFETKRLTKDGRVLDVDISAGRLDHPHGSPAGMVVILRDATERKRAENELQRYKTHLEELVEERTKELRQSEAQSGALLRTIPDAIMLVDSRGTYLDVRIPEGFETPLTAEMMVGKTAHEVMPPALADSNLRYVHKALATGELQQFEYVRFYAETEQTREYEVRIAPHSEDIVLAIFRDITERKQAERVLRQRVEELAMLNQIMQTVANMSDWNLMLRAVMRMMARLFKAHHTSVALLDDEREYLIVRVDYRLEKAREQPLLAGTRLPVSAHESTLKVVQTKRPLVIPDLQNDSDAVALRGFLYYQDSHCLMLVPLLARGEVVGLIGIELVEPERVFTGEEVKLAETIAGQMAGAIANARLYSAAQQELEERKKAQVELARARDEALEASRFKSQMLAKVSHELRTPLGVILGYTELLQGGTFGPVTLNQIEIAGEVIESTHYLTSMVNELLDQAKLESHALTIDSRPFKVQDLVNAVESRMTVLALTKGLELTFYLDEKLPPLMIGDQNRLQQIMINLVGNGIKFTEEGSVNVRLYRSQPGSWSIQVKDTGIGIPADAYEYIFEPFTQVDGSITRKQSGTGLGLSIVRQLTEFMGGYITLNSTLGEGSEFIVTLPLIPAQERKGA